MGDFFDDLLKKIFPNREGNPPLSVKENFSLKEKDLHDLEEWNKELKLDNTLEELGI